MKKRLLVLLLFSISIIACDNTSSSVIPSNNTLTTSSSLHSKTYTVTWVNYDNTILEVDEAVIEGSMPSYDSQTPTKEGNEEKIYRFNGWSPTIKAVTENITYVATFREIVQGEGTSPIFSSDGMTIQYGFYPQSNVSDSDLINELNKLTITEDNGWYYYNESFYFKTKAQVYNKETYKFDNGTTINHDEEYWFKCEPITWKILKEENDKYTLLSNVLLDTCIYYKDYVNRVIDNQIVYPNNYEYSDIRNFLNNEFFTTAFSLNNSFIEEENLDSSSTTDKVYLLNYQDYLSSNYGFETNAEEKSLTREAKTTDYARARGSWNNIKKDVGTPYTSTYWTRSPSNEYSYSAWNVNSGGYLSTYAVDGSSHCIRPSITISIK